MIPPTAKIWDLFGNLNMKMEKICLDEGDFIMWDSRTVHCNSPASKRDILSPELRRLVCYICMMPSDLVSDETVIWKRIEGVKKCTTTNHWPCEFTPSGQNDLKAIRPPNLSEDQIRLVTGDAYRKLWK